MISLIDVHEKTVLIILRIRQQRLSPPLRHECKSDQPIELRDVVPRAGVVSEAMLAWVLGEAMTEKFGGDHIDEMKRNFSSYIKSLGKR